MIHELYTIFTSRPVTLCMLIFWVIFSIDMIKYYWKKYQPLDFKDRNMLFIMVNGAF